MAEWVFWFNILLIIGSAVIVVHHRNLIYSAVALLFTFLGVAGLYIFLWADFLAGVQIMIYVGGILVLILFGIMLTHKIVTVEILQTGLQKIIAAISCLVLFGLLGWMIILTPWLQNNNQEPTQTVDTIGMLLMMDYLLPFEIASILLLGALIGAATLSRKSN